ncbi:ArsR/SmtB family transcription factor [Halospeciosus flavus]|uniref:ArsR/SmtB family transcription factor n=1 Tax=Halospeciosus flavus TaxID=3032283 RepID=A0ABD5Z3N7_9EURY|nr:metalloregulator ArsR/SmtB family transcription factor [Halospeciosus flavus]
MSQSTERLERLLTDELGECCAADVEARLDELDTLSDDAAGSSFDDDCGVFSTLGNETRSRIARILVGADDELCVCELEPLFDVSTSALSHALGDLVDAGLVTRRKEGNWRYYRSTERAERLFAVLDETRDDGGVDA